MLCTICLIYSKCQIYFSFYDNWSFKTHSATAYTHFQNIWKLWKIEAAFKWTGTLICSWVYHLLYQPYGIVDLKIPTESWSKVIKLEKSQRLETLVPEYTLITHHSLLLPPLDTRIYRIFLDHRKFLLRKQRRSSLLVRMCDILEHRIFTSRSYCLWGAVKRGGDHRKIREAEVLFSKKKENAGIHKSETSWYWLLDRFQKLGVRSEVLTSGSCMDAFINRFFS